MDPEPAVRVGVVLCPQMVEKARRNADTAGLPNVAFVEAGIEKLSLPDESVLGEWSD